MHSEPKELEINLKEIKGIIHGTKLISFKKLSHHGMHIKEPWLCLSLILRNRTVDFQFFNKQHLLYIMTVLCHFNPKLNPDIIINFPTLTRLNFLKLRLQHIANLQNQDVFQTLYFAIYKTLRLKELSNEFRTWHKK